MSIEKISNERREPSGTAQVLRSHQTVSGWSLLEHSPIALLVLDQEATITYATPAARELFGSFPVELLQAPLWQFIPGESRTPLQEAMKAVKQAAPGQRILWEVAIRHQDGRLQWCEFQFTNAMNDPEVQGIVLLLKDISRYKNGEQQKVHGEAIVIDEVGMGDGGVLSVDETGRIPTGTLLHEPSALLYLREQVQKALAQANQSKAAYQRLFEANLIGVIVVDEHLIHEANDAFLHMVGYSREDLEQGRINWRLLTPAEYAPRDEEALVELYKTGACAPFEKEYYHKDGHRVPILLGATAIESGVRRWVCFVVDRSEAAQLERAVAQQAQTLKTVFETMTDAVLVFDADGYIVQSNPSAQELLARYLTPRELTQPARLWQKEVFTKKGNDPRPPFLRLLQGETLAGESGQEVVAQTHDGEELILHVTGAPLRDADGCITGAVAVTRDLTAQHRQAVRTRAALQALVAMAEALVNVPPLSMEASEELITPSLARHFLQLACEVMQCDNATFFSRNPQTDTAKLVTTVGLSSEETEIMRQRAKGIRYTEYYADANFRTRLHAGEVILLNFEQPPYVERKPLSRLAQSLIVPIRLREVLVGVISLNRFDKAQEYTATELALARGTGRLAGLLIEREQLLQEAAQARASELAIRTTSELKDEFVSIASHELRTPLTTTKASVQQIRRLLSRLFESATTPTVQELQQLDRLLSRAEVQINRQNRLIRDLLDVSRIEQGHLEVRLVEDNLAAIVREVVEEQQQMTPTRRLELSVEEVFVLVDRDRVSQVMENYLSNALKYSPEDRPVVVQLEVKDGQVRVAVTDQGPGIPREELQRVWERFYRVPGIQVRSGSGIGLGLGLHISRTLIERQGGTVGVDSQPGVGSTFWFTLPILNHEQ